MKSLANIVKDTNYAIKDAENSEMRLTMKKQEWMAYGEQILIEPINEKDVKSHGGIVLPNNTKTMPKRAKVISIGSAVPKNILWPEDEEKQARGIKVGDIVLIQQDGKLVAENLYALNYIYINAIEC